MVEMLLNHNSTASAPLCFVEPGNRKRKGSGSRPLLRLGAGVLGCGLLIGCIESQPLSSSPSPERARELVEGLYPAWSLHEPERVDDILTEDAKYEDVTGGQIYQGTAEIKQLVHAAFQFAPDFRVRLRSLVNAGDRAMTEWEIEGTQSGPARAGPAGELPATGRTFRLRGASVLIFREGRIVQVTDYYDMATFLRQLGARFEPPQAPSP